MLTESFFQSTCCHGAARGKAHGNKLTASRRLLNIGFILPRTGSCLHVAVAALIHMRGRRGLAATARGPFHEGWPCDASA